MYWFEWLHNTLFVVRATVASNIVLPSMPNHCFPLKLRWVGWFFSSRCRLENLVQDISNELDELPSCEVQTAWWDCRHSPVYHMAHSRIALQIGAWNIYPNWLVVWNIFFHILGIILPIDYIIFFRWVQTTNQPNISKNRSKSGWIWCFGTMEFYDFPFSWEWNNHPNWLSLHDFSEG